MEHHGFYILILKIFFFFFLTHYTLKRNKKKNQTVCTLSERNGNQANTSLTSYHNAKWCKANAVLSPLGRLKTAVWGLMLTQWLKHAASVLLRLESILQYPLELFLYKHTVRIHKYILILICKSVAIWRESQKVKNFWNFFFLEESTCDSRFCVRGSRVRKKAKMFWMQF